MFAIDTLCEDVVILSYATDYLGTLSCCHVCRVGGEGEAFAGHVVAVDVVCLSSLEVEGLTLCEVGVGDEVVEDVGDRSRIIFCCLCEDF